MRFTAYVVFLLGLAAVAVRLKRSGPRQVTYDQFGIPKYENTPRTDVNNGVSNKVAPSPAHERGVKRKYTRQVESYPGGPNNQPPVYGNEPSGNAYNSGGSNANTKISYAEDSGTCYCPCAGGFVGSRNPSQESPYPHPPIVTVHKPQQTNGYQGGGGGIASYSNSVPSPPPGYIPPLSFYAPPQQPITINNNQNSYSQPSPPNTSYGRPPTLAPVNYRPLAPLVPSGNSYGSSQPSQSPYGGRLISTGHKGQPSVPNRQPFYPNAVPSPPPQNYPHPEPRPPQQNYLLPPSLLGGTSPQRQYSPPQWVGYK